MKEAGRGSSARCSTAARPSSCCCGSASSPTIRRRATSTSRSRWRTCWPRCPSFCGRSNVRRRAAPKEHEQRRPLALPARRLPLHGRFGDARPLAPALATPPATAQTLRRTLADGLHLPHRRPRPPNALRGLFARRLPRRRRDLRARRRVRALLARLWQREGWREDRGRLLALARLRRHHRRQPALLPRGRGGRGLLLVRAAGLRRRGALEAGFDVVELHMAHGYLLS